MDHQCASIPDSIKPAISAEDVVPLASQVAGHTYQRDKALPGMLKHKDGYVLKPLFKPTQAKTEVDFYNGLASAPYAKLMPFVPKCHGTASISTESYRGEVLILEDVTGGFEKPCIMDVKIGRQTWDPYATTSKIESEKKKYVECRRHFGFCIPGFQLYDSETNRLLKFDKAYGKSLDRNSLPKAFLTFLNLGKSRSAFKAIEVYIRKLHDIEEILSAQNKLHLYSSSILLTYDCAQIDSYKDASEWAQLHMIDFAHAIVDPSLVQGPDHNYLDGLKNLICVLQSLSPC